MFNIIGYVLTIGYMQDFSVPVPVLKVPNYLCHIQQNNVEPFLCQTTYMFVPLVIIIFQGLFPHNYASLLKSRDHAGLRHVAVCNFFIWSGDKNNQLVIFLTPWFCILKLTESCICNRLQLNNCVDTCTELIERNQLTTEANQR